MKLDKQALKLILEDKTIWILEEIGDDDWHPSSIMGVYDNEAAAEEQKAIEKAKGNPCWPQHPECDFEYSYSITEYNIQSQPNKNKGE